MDSEKVSFFHARFSSFDADALAELNQRRESLAEEACAALDQVLLEKGMSASMLSRFSTPKADMPATVQKRNWRLAGVQLIGALVVMVFASALAKTLPTWLSLLLVFGFVSWWVVGKLRSKMSKERSDETS